MDTANAIEVQNVSKSFKVYFDKGHTIKEHVVSSKRRRYENRVVLKDISFSVKQGEAVGLIGHNGCGKSTTLKLLTKIMYPDSGMIKMKGRVSSLIELGAGFHPDMSGRENIYINASIFGLGKKEIDQRLDDIIAFSELEEFIDNPVRTYSSGMYMRLAFSVAINVDADILLIDEILAVGDVNFQAKCFDRLREIKAQGTTIVIVSHSLGQIEQICDRSIWIHDGLIKAEGLPRDIHPMYLSLMGERRQEIAKRMIVREKKQIKDEMNEEVQEISEIEPLNGSNVGKTKDDKRWGNGNARLQYIYILDSKGQEQTVFRTGEDIQIKLIYKVNKPVKDAVFGISIFRSDGLLCYGTNTKIERFDIFDLKKDSEVWFDLNNFSLLPGEYSVDVSILCGDGISVDFYREAIHFEMMSEISDMGVMRAQHIWHMNP